MLPYMLRQLVWMLTSALQLVYALSTGILWVLQMLRLFAYGACVGICFIPHWWWYLTSPNIIRRVSYRSSDTTKKRNILRVLEAEGVDLHEVLRRTATSPQSSLPVGVRRRRVLAGPRSGGGNNRNEPLVRDEGVGGAGARTNDSSSGRRGGRPLPPRRRPVSDVATVSGSRSGHWSRKDVEDGASSSYHFGYYYGSGGGEVMEAALSPSPGDDMYSGSAAVSYPPDNSPSLQRRRRLMGPPGGTTRGLHLHESSLVNAREGEGDDVRKETHGNRHSYSSSLQPHSLLQHHPHRQQYARRAPPLPRTTSPHFMPGGHRRLRPAQTTSDVQVSSTALERLMGAAPVHLNPADGSAMRSLPVQRHYTQDNAATAAVGRSIGAPHRLQRLSASPHRAPPLTLPQKTVALDKPEPASVKQCSSSSCDMTVNKPENSSADEDGVGAGVGGGGVVLGHREAKLAAPATLSSQLCSYIAATPAVAAEAVATAGTKEEANASSPMPIFEGQPVYYGILPKVEATSDPLLKDVLAALQEGEVPHSEAMEEAVETQLPRVALRKRGPRQTLPGVRRRGEEGSGSGVGSGQGRQQRRSSQRRPAHSPQLLSPQFQQQQQHTRSASEENLLAGLDEEDEEDKMNLHNRATVDIVLPVPLDSLMKSLEYSKHSKRLRRKRFPIVIDVTGAVWIIGSHLWSTMMARVLAQRGYVVFCPDYRNFPQTTMEGMTLDVSDAIAWVLSNAERYNGDLSNVTLIGQSAGAHLTMMSLLSQAQLCAFNYNQEHGLYEEVPPPSDVAYNVPRYNPREAIHRYVGLSGMYNIEGLVDHFQREGLNTPVVHQIVGGRDQLARYSIHAYFDDRRGGDTGEVLPDNIFDYFPQQMFFVHGDADKSAPVTESASLVAMLRGAQERYAVRRSERNEEARRHALRSRWLLPVALAATGNSSMNLNDGLGEEGSDQYGYHTGTRGVNVSPPSTLQWAQRTEREEDDSRSGGAAPTHTTYRSQKTHSAHVDAGDDEDEETAHAERRTAHGYDYHAHTASPMVSVDPAAESTSIGDNGSAHRRAYTTAEASGSMQATIVSPIVPPSRQDQPKSPVELGFIVIPDGRHSDAFVDECIAAGRSCCVDFLCDYDSAVDLPTSSFAASLGNGPDGDSFCGSLRGSSYAAHGAEHIPAWMAQSSEVCAMPDSILPLAVPTEERSLPLRLCTLICPF